MSRMIGTVARGIRAPIIKAGDDIASITVKSLLEASREGRFSLQDRDVIAITEAIVARAQGNYASVEDIASDVRAKMGGDTIGVLFPILSRNRFSVCLRGIAKGAKKIVLMLSYPSDEVGNHLVHMDLVDEKRLVPFRDVLTMKKYRAFFGDEKHPFTGIDYVEYYESIIRESGAEVEILFANDPKEILKYTQNVLCCDIHTRERTKRILKNAGGEVVLGLDDILNASVNGSGYHEKYGLLGSNKAGEDRVKLFPRDCQEIVDKIQGKIFEETGKRMDVMIYGDGAFKDPVGKIWELADPVVSPAYTKGLEGTPNELKLKYLADHEFGNLSGEELKSAIIDKIRNKEDRLLGKMDAEGTTPRRISDLIGSLSDLISGSGDKGTPIVLIQGYFDNYSME